MARRVLGPVGGAVIFSGVAALVFAGLGWVTVAGLRVEDAQREAAAQAALSGNLRVALLRLDARMLPALSGEDIRPYYHYAGDSTADQPVPSPLLEAGLPPWMRLHFQIDADAGWESPQVPPPAVMERFRADNPPEALANCTDERRELLAVCQAKFPARQVVDLLSGREKPVPSDGAVPAPGASPATPPAGPQGVTTEAEVKDTRPAPTPAGAAAPAAEGRTGLAATAKKEQAERFYLFGVEVSPPPAPVPAAMPAPTEPAPPSGALASAPRPGNRAATDPDHFIDKAREEARDASKQPQLGRSSYGGANPGAANSAQMANGTTRNAPGAPQTPGALLKNMMQTAPKSHAAGPGGRPADSPAEDKASRGAGVMGGRAGGFGGKPPAMPEPEVLAEKKSAPREAGAADRKSLKDAAPAGPPAGSEPGKVVGKPVGKPVTPPGDGETSLWFRYRGVVDGLDDFRKRMTESLGRATDESRRPAEQDKEKQEKRLSAGRMLQNLDRDGKKDDTRRRDGVGRDEPAAGLKADAPPAVVAPPAPGPIAVHLGPMHPQWLAAADGSETLVLVRVAQVTRPGGDTRSVYQGVVLDWPRLGEDLREVVKDVFPEATLARVTDPETVPADRAMRTLPVQLDPGPTAAAPPPGWTPLRIGLVLAWAAAVIAFAAVGLSGWSLIDLAERRIRFVSAVTHELRTPLTSLRLYLDMLVSGMVQDERKRAEYLETLNVESDRLHRLIDNVLDYARLERRRTRADAQKVPVGELLEALRQTWADRCGTDGKELVVISTLPAEQAVCTDRHLVGQIVGNLIDNARKYTRDAADPRIWVWAKPVGRRWVVFEVEDRGPGVPPGERRSVFRPFRRGDAADPRAGGAGLGLALAKQWAEALGGRLTYRPADGGTGACFRLELRVR